MLDILIAWALPTFLTICLGYIAKELKGNRRNNIAMKESMIILLRSHITTKIESYFAIGYLPDYARSCLEKLYEQYQSLGGNHGVQELINQCFRLPPVKVERSE
ncbi:MAG: hypothetical protein RSB72_02200 [Bacilli bacterium]